MFLSTFHKQFPQFAEKDETGRYLQHDAEEAFSLLYQQFENYFHSVKLDSLSNYKTFSSIATEKGAISDLFTGKFERKFYNIKAPTENNPDSVEFFSKITCPLIDNTGETPISNLLEGLKSSMFAYIDKESPTLGHTVKYEVTTRIIKAPKYLVIHLNRFSIKKNKDKFIQNKILRSVQFKMVLDIVSLLSKDLKQYVNDYRKLKLEKETENFKNLNSSNKDVKLDKKEDCKDSVIVNDKDIKMDKKEDCKDSVIVNDKDIKMDKKEDCKDSVIVNDKVPLGLKFCPNAKYELCSVITHQGRSSDSGHYLSYVKQSDDKWAQFDDEKVKLVTDKDVMKTYGTADFHIAYMLLYRAIT